MKANVNTIIKEFKIKGMVCSRCLKVLDTELKESGAKVIDIQLGKIVIKYNPKKITNSQITEIIHENEFEVISDKGTILGEQTKQSIINYLWNSDFSDKLSDYLFEKTKINYDNLSKNFSKIYHKTIERYALLLKVERAKELIENGELNFSEIAFILGYQNLSALSRQFKRETGITMKDYKNLGISKRIPLDRI